jgi:hypothetical protein
MNFKSSIIIIMFFLSTWIGPKICGSLKNKVHLYLKVAEMFL